MAESECTNHYKSYSMQEPILRNRTPARLLRVGPLSDDFNSVNGQLKSNHVNPSSMKDVWKHEEPVSGSNMVKRQKPYPELKPNYAQIVKKALFEQDWVKEHRKEIMRKLEEDRQLIEQKKLSPEPIWER